MKLLSFFVLEFALAGSAPEAAELMEAAEELLAAKKTAMEW